ncbi:MULTISPECIES: fluoride efflux transporter CrcB [unclassified Frigoribacterium]|uniref:fluoride efflux transporter CrcB n=1 Tax=unclassified Frigoribacterium TaxID=2627005 RepID=UPI0012F25563|nr:MULTISPECIES: fluoride efflux transporter CrcB [unclassified Frigoribacterium]MBD8140931.1 fluoride efflux transporter CrcB [Frigoribacterium sp. CFBP 13605]VXB96842.1 putative fluoride ion transporter CrcB 1 [Frigoribacterium sp. 9N]
MSPLLVVAVAVAGGVGAATRFVVDGLVKDRLGSAYPWGTTVINVSGSFALGLLTGLALQAVVTPEWKAVLGTGLLGGYTTFSTASVETVRLLAAGRRGAAVANGLGMLVACVGVASLGLWLGSLA